MTITVTAQGKKFNFPDGTTQEQMGEAVDSFFQNKAQQVKEPSVGDQALGALETAGTLLSGIPATIGGGVSGLVTAGLTGDASAGEDVRKRVTESLTFRGGKESQEQLEALGSAAQAIDENVVRPAIAGTAGLVDVALNPSQLLTGAEQARGVVRNIKEKGLGKAAGDQALESTDSPLFASIVSTLPTALGLATGGIAKPKGIIRKPTPLKESLANKIQSGSTDKKFAKLLVDGAGKIKKDRLAISAIKQGFDEGVISAIKGSSKLDRERMAKMVSILDEGRGNARFAAQNRPADVAGESLLKRVAHVKKVNSNAGKRLNKVANSLKNKPIDLNREVKTFFDGLNDLGVTFSEGLKPNFKGSQIESIAPAKKLVKDLALRISRSPDADAFDAHQFKKFIDENVTFGKSAKGLGGTTERLAKQLRANIDNKLDSSFPAYNKVNTEFSDTIKAIDSLQDAAGRKVNLFGENAAKSTGTVLRRLMSNTQSRVNLMDAISDIENVGRKYNGKFDDDILTQMLFADELDSMFGAPSRTSLRGEVGKAVSGAVRKTASERALDAAGGVIEKARGVNDDAAITSMKELLRRKGSNNDNQRQ